MSHKRKFLRYKKERCILSDVLPYEVPLTFGNKNFYEFLIAHHVRYDSVNKFFTWKKCSEALNQFIRILLGVQKGSLHDPNRDFIGPPSSDYKIYGIRDKDTGKGKEIIKGKIPFSYKINHKDNEYRELAIPHPVNQLEMIEFYDRCKELILYYCSLSKFSIRSPAKIAKYSFYKDRIHYERLAEDGDKVIVEQYDQEYEHVRSFFVYRKFSNVYKFYESRAYHRAERSFNALEKLDISKCFDSIYTHSVQWAILGKEVVKHNITPCNKTFAGRFDKIMQRTKYDETNGIIIGPEFSRIFAEIILQSVDVQVEKQLRESPKRLKFRTDYLIFRYVDDYFIFFNHNEDRDLIVQTLCLALKEYGLTPNSAKAILYNKPIITEISRAKRRIADLFEDKLKYKLEEISDEVEIDKKHTKGNLFVDAKTLIIEFKTILKECNIEYRDILTYSFATIEIKCDRIVKEYRKVSLDYSPNKKKDIVHAFSEVLQFVFFIFSVSPKVNSTVRLCRILRIICSFGKFGGISHDHKHYLYKQIFDGIHFVLKKYKHDKFAQVETLYLLIILSELGKAYWLEENVLAQYLNIESMDDGSGFRERNDLNYFAISVALFYMRDKKRYKQLRDCVEKSILLKYQEKSGVVYKDAELTLLCLDLISCPYVLKATKEQILATYYEIDDQGVRNSMLNFKNENGLPQEWFTTWRKFDFGKELDRKKGFEVY